MAENDPVFRISGLAAMWSGACALFCRLNIPMKTLGGKQFWSDVRWLDGWRIQRHCWTGRCRLLDDRDVRRVCGSMSLCDGALQGLSCAKKLRRHAPHVVVLLHGIGRSTGTFANLVNPLKSAGYDVANLSYASTRRTIEQHAGTISELVSSLTDYETISFVTHSMGGLVLRQILSCHAEWLRRLPVARIIQIAPPNQGSVIARYMKANPLYGWIYGVAGQQLTPGYVKNLPPLSEPFGIIVGGTGDARGLNPWLGSDNDGTVLVSETSLPEARDVIQINAFHVSISNNPQAVQAVLTFLRWGQFEPPTSPVLIKKDEPHA